MIAILVALASALCLAVASVLQHRAGSAAADATLRSSLRHPLWCAGAVAGVAGFVLHVIALTQGALSVVQPLLVCGLLFALPLSRLLDRSAIRLADVGAAAAVVGGLAVFQLTARPAAGTSSADLVDLAWCMVALLVAGTATLLVAWRRPRVRASWLGLCTGIAYGLTAALVKSTVGAFQAHGIGVLGSWPLYAFLVVVAGAIAVNQLAFNAGPLALSLPLITIVDPVVSIVIGAVAFAESVSSGGGALAGQLLGFAVMSAGVVALSRRAAAPEPVPVPA